MIGQNGVSHKGDVMMEINAIHHNHTPEHARVHARTLTAQSTDFHSPPRATPVNNTGNKKRGQGSGGEQSSGIEAAISKILNHIF